MTDEMTPERLAALQARREAGHLKAEIVRQKDRADAAEAKLAEAESRIDRLRLTQRRLFEGDQVRLLEEAEAKLAEAVRVIRPFARYADRGGVTDGMPGEIGCFVHRDGRREAIHTDALVAARAFLASLDKETTR